MSHIMTVLGPLAPEQLGFTDSHGHLIMDRDLIVAKTPDFKIDDVNKVCVDVQEFMAAGGRAMVEMSCIGVGRSVRKMVEIAQRTGLHVIASTGIQKSDYYLDSHWQHFYTPDQMAQVFVEEIEQGMDANSYNGPFVDRTPARAGVIKIATPYHFVPPEAQRVIEAAAIAHRQTGAPISSHTEQGTMGLQQVELLTRFGVDPAHIVVGHLDRNPDFYTHREIAETGAYLLYDTPSRVKYFPECTFIDLVRRMVDAGYGRQIVWGSDIARRSYFVGYGGGPGMAYVPQHFVPRMRKEGFPEEVIQDIFVHNPARAFTFAAH